MKVFIQKRIVFISLIFLMCFTVILSNYYLVESTTFSFKKGKKVLVLGDSNIKYAINDSIFNNSVNFSGEADSYFYSYIKLNRILEEKSNDFNTVFLSFSPHNIIGNDWVFNEEDMITRFPKYYPLMSTEDLKFLFKDKHDVFLSSIARIHREFPNTIMVKIEGSFMPFYGGFKFVDSNNLILELDKLSKNKSIPILPNNNKISPEEILYLNKIIALCKNNNLKIILINPPKRKELLKHEKYFVAEFNQFYDKELKNISFLDFSNVVLPDEYYSDLVHLNYKGADYFSKLLKNQDLTELMQTYKRSSI